LGIKVNVDDVYAKDAIDSKSSYARLVYSLSAIAGRCNSKLERSAESSGDIHKARESEQLLGDYLAMYGKGVE
jgi:hypothetical protein